MKTNLSLLKWLIPACLLLALPGCKRQSLKDAALQRIDQISSQRQLELVEFEVRRFLKAEDKGILSIANKTVLLSCKAYLQAGIDLADFNPMTDVVIDEDQKSISITLPYPTLLSMDLPLEDALVESQKVPIIRSRFKMADMNMILRLGEQQILDSVPTLGILDEAKQNARLFFEPLLKHLGFSSVYVTFKEPVKK